MTHCAKCGAELIGSRKFCAACGTPAGDPRSPAASTGASPAAPASEPGTGAGPGGPSPAAQVIAGPSSAYAPGPPISQVNPFAQTAGPGRDPRASDYGPPPSIPPELASTTPGIGDPSAAPQVSPLAVSNVDSRRGAFDNAGGAALANALGASEPSSSGVKRGVPGTQLMSVPSTGLPPMGAPSTSGPAASGPAPSSKQGKTQLLQAFPPGSVPFPPPTSGGAPGPVAAPAASAAPAAAPPAPGSNPPGSSYGAYGAPNAPQPPPAPQGAPQPAPGWNPSAYGGAPVPAQPRPPTPMQPMQPMQPMPPQPGMPYVQGTPQPFGPVPAANPYAPQVPQHAAPYPPQAPPAPPHAQPFAPPQPQYGFGYAPGSRVHVTWSNGQRYPGTVQEVRGSQCCVIFPDGQQHWVELQYVAPA